MKASTLIFLLLFLVSACRTARVVPTSDSTRVEVRTEVKTIRDTAWLELPVFIEKVATLDTISSLENRYAKSQARVSGGILTHSLETKPVREPVAVDAKEIVRDSIVYRDRIETRVVEVEKSLSGWQRFRLNLGTGFLLTLAVASIYFLFKLTKNL